MLNAIQHSVQVFANLVVASTMGLSLAIGVAGAFQHRFPLECVSCHGSAMPTLTSAIRAPLLIASSN
jgi:hypothetical protein